uniref:Uncharacterized protein n=1 Tax=viral metagenome TaxID=1070528 RepID=A0A6C0J8R5_9ZZZZ
MELNNFGSTLIKTIYNKLCFEDYTYIPIAMWEELMNATINDLPLHDYYKTKIYKAPNFLPDWDNYCPLKIQFDDDDENSDTDSILITEDSQYRSKITYISCFKFTYFTEYIELYKYFIDPVFEYFECLFYIYVSGENGNFDFNYSDLVNDFDQSILECKYRQYFTGTTIHNVNIQTNISIDDIDEMCYRGVLFTNSFSWYKYLEYFSESKYLSIRDITFKTINNCNILWIKLL